jgi:hypothetical protein
VNIPDSVTSINARCFAGCPNLEEITLPFVGKVNYDQGVGASLGYIFGMANEGEDFVSVI